MAGRPRKNNVSMEEMIKHQEDAVEKAKSTDKQNEGSQDSTVAGGRSCQT